MNSAIPAYGGMKRKRGASHSVLMAAQHSADPARSAYVSKLKQKAPGISQRVAQQSLFIPKGRSGIRHLLKQNYYKDKMAYRDRTHHHDIMRKYNRAKPTNGIKSFISTYSQ